MTTLLATILLATAAVATADTWCGGAYDPEKGTNFAACGAQPDRLAEVQAGGGDAEE